MANQKLFELIERLADTLPLSPSKVSEVLGVSLKRDPEASGPYVRRVHVEQRIGVQVGRAPRCRCRTSANKTGYLSSYPPTVAGSIVSRSWTTTVWSAKRTFLPRVIRRRCPSR